MAFKKRYQVPILYEKQKPKPKPKRKPVKKEHLKDIDFRTREQRQSTSTETFVQWYNELVARLEYKYDDRTAGQLEILSAVLWHILPVYEYDTLRSRTKWQSLEKQTELTIQ